MNVFRRLSSRALVVLGAACVVVAAVGAAVAMGALGGGGGPPASVALDQAIANALAGPPVAGVTADFTYDEHLFDASSLGSLGSLIGLTGLSSGTGQLWVAGDGHARIELQSGLGDVEIADDGSTLTAYLAATNTAYELPLPAPASSAPAASSPPSLAEIDSVLTELGRYAQISAPTPGTIAGQPAYTVTVSPAGSAAGPTASVSFDANTAVPLQLALDAAGSSSPVLDLTVTSITYGAVPASQVDFSPPAGATIDSLTPASLRQLLGFLSPASGLSAVTSGVAFTLQAPDSLNGLARGEVRQIGSGATAGALISYRSATEGLEVFEAPAGSGSGPLQLLDLLPAATFDGGGAHELVTGFGSVLSFDHGGVSFTLLGSLDQSDIESAAQALAG